MRLTEIPDDGIIRIPIMDGYRTIGHRLIDLADMPTIDLVRCRECKNYVIVDEFEGGKRYMCLVNHFSYLDNDGDNQFCSYGERKEGADNG